MMDSWPGSADEFIHDRTQVVDIPRISAHRDEVEAELLAARFVVSDRVEQDIRDARKSGASWAKIGRELGTSGKASRQRYGDRVA